MKQKPLIIKPKRPKGEDGYKVFPIRIKEGLAEQLDLLVAQTGRSRNELIGMFIEYALERCQVEEAKPEST